LSGTAAGALGLALGTPARAQLQPFTPTLTIGVAGPFTGDSLRLGEQIANGVREAIDYHNNFRSTFERVFSMRTFDDQNFLASAQVTAQFAADDPTIVAVVGHLSGKITDAALRTYSNAHIPLVIPASTYDPLTSHGYGGVARLATKDSTEGELCATYLTKLFSAKRPVTLAQDGDYGYDVAQGFLRQCARDKVDARQLIFKWEKPDYAAAAKDALALKPDLVFLAGIARSMGPVIDELRKAGYGGPLSASQGFFDPVATDRFGKNVEGLVVSTSFPPIDLAPAAFRYRADYEERYGAFTPLAAFGYAAAQVAMQAAGRTNLTDRAAIASELTRGGYYDTLIGMFQFSAFGDPVDPNVYFYTIKSGQFVYQKAAHPTSFLLK
jgi:branched-chain amino acid transport system substrate-binding protein